MNLIAIVFSIVAILQVFFFPLSPSTLIYCYSTKEEEEEKKKKKMKKKKMDDIRRKNEKKF
jgi:hypothetical protein